ncbi:MAG: heavy metal translocating P-type ATPase [Lachnospiraceae bacterium]|nr:heavy metal translocating P-type ATPase [Lachnospiraceae bacterium]
MRFKILHEIKGRMRIHIVQKQMNFQEADILQYYLTSKYNIVSVKIYERTQDVAICYRGNRKRVIKTLQEFSYETVSVPDYAWENSGRKVNREYWDKLVQSVVMRVGSKWFLPAPVRTIITVVKSGKYIWNGIRTLARGKIEVPVLDGTAIAISLLRGDMKTASSIMFLLGIGEILEEWTHKKSVDDLARSMSLNISKVWFLSDGKEILVDAEQIKQGDNVVIHVGNVIPFDGVVVEGEGAVNQSSLTGESLPVLKDEGGYVYAGTVLEEGEITVQVKETSGSNKFEKIVTMIEESEKLKSTMEGKAAHLADKLVPYTLLGTGLVYLFTRNVTKALSVLMVDFSCALKLAMPISVLSAIREAGTHKITVKGGKFLEKVAEADTIVFDKTGTLTKAQPTVVEVVPFIEENPDELLRTAACLEEHFPHSMAKAVVNAAQERGLTHEEKHSKVEYIVAHGISSKVDGKKVVIGSYHFVFEDEGCRIPEGMKERFDNLTEEYSHLYLAIEGQLAAAICIEDPVREEAAIAVKALRKVGFDKIVMMTGDNERTACSIATRVGVDEYYAGVLPEDKAKFVEKEKAAGRNVIMVGDGINDSPALSAADVGIAISDGAQIAREIADITIEADDLLELLTLKKISNGLLKRTKKNYASIVGINTGLIVLGICGMIQPTTSALLHNTSTLAISLNSMKDILDKKV